jgi:hypothetical protein
MIETIKKYLSSIFGNERIQGLLAGGTIGLIISMLIFGYRIEKINVAGIHFENPNELILNHQKKIMSLEKQNEDFKKRIAKLESELHLRAVQLGEFEGKLIVFQMEMEMIKIKNLR